MCCWPAANPSGTWCCVRRSRSPCTRRPSGRPLGNQVGWMAVPLPVGEPCHARRLAPITAATAERKKNARPQITSGIFRFIPPAGLQPPPA